MEDTHGHHRQSVILDRQPVGEGQPAAVATDTVIALYTIGIPPLAAQAYPAAAHLLGELCPVIRVALQTRQVVVIGPLSPKGAEVVQVDLVLHLFVREDPTFGTIKEAADEAHILRCDPLLLVLASLAPPDPDTGISRVAILILLPQYCAPTQKLVRGICTHIFLIYTM